MSDATTTKRRRGRGIAALAKSLLKREARIKGLYKLQDAELALLLAKAKPGRPIALGGGRSAIVVDNYADGKLKVFRAHGIARFELKAVD